jgi:hypothetical protein
MILSSLLLFAAQPLQAEASEPTREPTGRVTVYRLGQVETLEGDAQKNVSLLVRDGVIERMGQAVIIPDNAEVIDLRRSGQVATPPLVLTHANWLIEGRRSGGRNSQFLALDSLWLEADWEQDLLEEGVLLVGVDPPGSGLPGRTSVLEVDGQTGQPEPLVADLHLKVTMASSSSAKKLIRDAWKAAEEAIEKEEKAEKDWKKAREEWEAKQKEKEEAAKKEEKAKKDGNTAAQDGDKKEQEEEAPPETFEPPKMKPDVTPLVDWVRQERVGQLWLRSASDWLHWQDLLGERELPYEIVLRHGRSQNFGEVASALAATELRVEVPAVISFLPFTRVRANLPAELAAAGVEKLILAPPNDSLTGVRSWRLGAARVVAEGLNRQVALRGMSVEAAASLGQEEMIAPLKTGSPATFVIWSGDPLDPMSEVDLVVSAGKVVYDRAKKEKEEAR